MRDDQPVGLVQRSRYADYPEYLEELGAFLSVPGEAVTIDYFIGEADDVNRGIGTEVIAAIVADTWGAYPAAPAIVVPVATANRPSWRALERAGFIRVAEGELEPDNPIDDRLHVVYRIDRPAVASDS